MMTLLEKAKELGKSESPNWLKYREVFFLQFDEKKNRMRSAVRWIADQEGLSKDQVEKFYATAKRWKR